MPRREELSAEAQRQLLRRLQASWGGDPQASWIETHISIVLLHAGRAFKFKKALRNPFLDQSTLARRRQACELELRLNRRLAPDLYLDLAQVSGSVADPVLGGAGPALDVAVQMRAFDTGDLWGRLAARGRLRATDVDALAQRLARFHAEAAVASPSGPLGTVAQLREVRQGALRSLRDACRDAAERSGVDRLARWQTQALDRLAPLLQQRLQEGRVRECHGDLHLGNIAQVDGVPTPFDGIEFDETLRWLDVADEIAFLAMDLQAHGLPGLAQRFLDRYLQLSGDYGAVPALDSHRVHRALVRALVLRLRAAQPDATTPAERPPDYLALAHRLTLPRRPALLITHGLSGSGKTSQTQALLEAAGALRIRADVERKRLAGLEASARSDSALHGGLYDAAATRATYARLLRAATPALCAGWPVILDATYLRRWQRAAVRRWAARLGLPFAVLAFEAEPAELQRRLRARAAEGADASEADEQVLAWQRRNAEPLRASEAGRVFRLGASGPADWSPVLAWLAQQAPTATGLEGA